MAERGRGFPHGGYMIPIPKGTKDMLPQDAYKWHYVENKAREVASLFGFRSDNTIKS